MKIPRACGQFTQCFALIFSATAVVSMIRPFDRPTNCCGRPIEVEVPLGFIAVTVAVQELLSPDASALKGPTRPLDLFEEPAAAPPCAESAEMTTRQNLTAMTADGASFSVMVGSGENYLAAFCLAAGLGEVVAGLVTSAPLLAGAILQLISPWAVRRLGSHRRWVVFCASVQAASFLPLVAAALIGRISAPLMFFIAAFYYGAGLAGGPAWNSWVAHIVPPRVRARYFGRRTRTMQAGLLLGFLGGGTALQLTSSAGERLPVFAVLFAVAGTARFVSAYFLSTQSEPVRPAADAPPVSLLATFRRLRSCDEGRLLLYVICVQGGAQIASPFFTPYMLSQLHFSYATYALVIATSLTTKIITAPLWGRVAQRLGARRLLWLGGMAVIPLPGMWVLSSSVEYLMFVQVMAGAGWAAYELATSLMYFEAIAAEDRTSVLALLNTGHATATVAGSLFGGAILTMLGEVPNAYLAVFAASSLARFVTLPMLRSLKPPAEILPVEMTAAREAGYESTDEGATLPFSTGKDSSPRSNDFRRAA